MTTSSLPTDADILALFYARDEAALRLIDQKYRSYLYAVANHILNNHADTEECINDTYLDAWNTIPPAKPRILPAYLVTIARRRALDVCRRKHRKKRGGKQGEAMLSQDALDTLLAQQQQETEELARRLGEILNRYLGSLSPQQRYLFISRYYVCRPVKEIARAQNVSRSTVQKQLAAMKQQLKRLLESEGITL